MFLLQRVRRAPLNPHGLRGLAATSAAITSREADFSRWYLDVIGAADLTDAGPVKGSVILKPNGYAIWEAIRYDLDARIRASGALNAYFPLLLPTSFFAREAAHVAGFAKECAVVTHHRLRVAPSGSAADASAEGKGRPVELEPDPTAELGEPLVIRPTSETVIWDAFSRWIKSHRDLPLVLNQWANVVRWEMRTRPFLRTSEFLWQEGHTAHATQAEAQQRAVQMLQVYKSLCEDVLAMPVITGPKSPSERFAGADDTLTCEAMMPNGWALQSATSHFLGQNFAKAFNVQFTAPTGERSLVWATSWGASTRLIGGAIMSHSDDTGLVLPPALAPVQVAILPLIGGKAASASVELKQKLTSAADALKRTLSASGLRVAVDDDLDQPPGPRFYSWERRGVPLRIEIGPKDLTSGVVTLRDRLGGPRQSVPLQLVDGIVSNAAEVVASVQASLMSVHSRLLAAARARLEANTIPITSYSELKEHAASASSAASHHGGDSAIETLEDLLAETSTASPPVAPPAKGKKADGSSSSSNAASSYTPPWRMFLAPWHDDAAAEAAIKAETRYTIRCFPYTEQGRLLQGGGGGWGACFYSGKRATHMALFARAF